MTYEYTLLSGKEVQRMDRKGKKDYYDCLRAACMQLKVESGSLFNDIVKKSLPYIASRLRHYNLEIVGEKNIPDRPVCFVCNHSNSHDFFTIQEVFHKIGRLVTPFAASDCLGYWALSLFKAGNCTLIDRSNQASAGKGLLAFSKKMIEGEDGIICSEATWNLHPIRPMLPLKTGGTQSALIAGTVIIPTIFEYVEVPELVTKERELYTRCIVTFGEPITVKIEDDLFEKTKQVQTKMEHMRLNLWEKLNIRKNSIEDIQKDIYLNHTYLKKFGAFGFKYDSEHEFQYLLKDQDGQYENEFHIDQNGNFVPGITHEI